MLDRRDPTTKMKKRVSADVMTHKFAIACAARKEIAINAGVVKASGIPKN